MKGGLAFTQASAIKMADGNPGQPLKIALVCDWFAPRVGGIELHLEELARRLRGAGNDVTVITPTPGPGDSGGPVRVVRLAAPLAPRFGFIWTPGGLRALRRALEEGAFDLVHAHSSIISPAANGAAFLAVRLGIPCVVTVHSIWAGFACVPRALDAAFAWSRWPVVFSAVSERAARDMRGVLGPVPVAVLPNALDPSQWRIAGARRRPGVTAACAMRLARKKQGGVLLRAFAAARRRIPPGARLRLLIAGEGPRRPSLSRLAVRLGLGDCVEFLGAVDRAGVRDLLAASDFFVLPTRMEAFGIAALEARAAGLPVVAMREGGVGEFIRDGVDGLLARDACELSAHIARLATDDGLRRRMGDECRDFPAAFTWAAALPAHLDLYRRARVLAGSTRP